MKCVSLLLVLVCLLVELAASSKEGEVITHVGSVQSSVHSGPGNARDAVSWATKCADGGGDSVIEKDLEFNACSSKDQKCDAGSDIQYTVNLYFKPTKTEATLNVELSPAKADGSGPILKPKEIPISGPFNTTSEHKISFGLNFNPAVFYGNDGVYNFKVKLYNPSDNRTVFCRTFPVTITTLGFNPGNSYGAPCTEHSFPCSFENSVCNVDKCICDEKSFYEPSRGCKKRVFMTCNNTMDCISHATCLSGNCRCSEGFDHEAGENDVCTAGSAALVLSGLTLLTFQMVALLLQKFY